MPAISVCRSPQGRAYRGTECVERTVGGAFMPRTTISRDRCTMTTATTSVGTARSTTSTGLRPPHRGLRLQLVLLCRCGHGGGVADPTPAALPDDPGHVLGADPAGLCLPRLRKGRRRGAGLGLPLRRLPLHLRQRARGGAVREDHERGQAPRHRRRATPARVDLAPPRAAASPR